MKFNKNLFPALLFMSCGAFAQSNKAGTVHASVVLDGLLGSSLPTLKDANKHDNTKGFAIGYNLGFKASIGISEKISIGFLIRKEGGAAWTATEPAAKSSAVIDIKRSGISFAPEVKIYLTNADKYNVYFAPSLGYSKSVDDITVNETQKFKIDAAGVNYGALLGGNWYPKGKFGLSFDLGLNGNIMGGKGKTVIVDYSVSNAYVLLSVGAVVKL